MKSRWIDHQGKKIFYSDLSNFHTNMEALEAELEEATNFVANEPVNSALGLMDIRNTLITLEVLPVLQEAAVKSSYIRKAAVVGVQPGMRMMLFNVVTGFVQLARDTGPIAAFENLDDALNWLVNEKNNQGN